ncbi:MAG TPA: hypothetical protein HA230_02610 [Candidatus Aenigmarchaeota archaeon]|nr:hypothetical protein [Candidatus Aenigmarchaeota archaeon]
MENYTFETEDNAFHCVECEERIKVDVVQKEPRPVSCEKCGIAYLVAKSPEGLGMTVEVLTKSEPDIISEEEKNLEEEDS